MKKYTCHLTYTFPNAGDPETFTLHEGELANTGGKVDIKAVLSHFLAMVPIDAQLTIELNLEADMMTLDDGQHVLEVTPEK